jgi:hypothetical protein
MDIFEMLDDMYENKNLRIKKKYLYTVKQRIKCLYEDLQYAKGKAYFHSEWQPEMYTRREELYNYLLSMLDTGVITEGAYHCLKNYLLK